ncbi:hypothetical protein MLD38_013629 [Melastoma candidum]|uniref:Uncharacterized protein n=1 Tax=Melastoma candidum TaxID=119954 RepID=A0ACB9RBD1_9MYRT|nr:hypothetical protein MLD38_013629 [Melastoma candidum]
MSQGRGSASFPPGKAPLLLFYLALLLSAQMDGVRSATYVVGGPGGWTFNVVRWTDGKRFRAGDVLVFNYDSTNHNVVAVDRGSYNGCKTPAGAKLFTSGSDRIRLAKGQNYFICNFSGHCESGMKIAVSAA